ncbi:MAG: RNA-guided pseudouridylation complex pseudouridine synthase subunit Cbf5 [Candidatus Aenigmarchaeota archaeon]|nr:RNA-guided pseudouridylation complex pseudouridine synthase subunit Cbf5 [Candidatus Aenigmarchaeota archaeon]
MIDFLIREESKPSKYGWSPEKRPIEEYIRNGIIILDKWSGPTSHDVADFVRRKLNLEKAASTGTLDPMVSGVLPITIENSCKIVEVMQRVNKEYIGIIHFHKDVDEAKLKEVLKKFTGVIKQKPPRISAVARKLRKRTIYEIKILDKSERNYCLGVKCEAGTYIRVLFHQIGEALGTGAHMKELRRIQSGSFSESQSHKINEVIDAYNEWKSNKNENPLRKIIIPMEKFAENMKKIIVKDSSIYSISQGSPLFTTGISKIQKDIEAKDLIAIFSLKSELIALGIANISAKDMLEQKASAVKIKRVIIERDIYPKFK